MALFYLPEIKQGVTQLTPEESKHAVKVLRLSQGDAITLIDGVGGWYDAIIEEANPKKCRFAIQSSRQEPGNDYYIHIAIAPTKNIDRIEWFVEKAVEIGVDEISFLLCSNSERKVIKTDRIEKKAISAAKQSLKATLPKINALQKIDQFFTSISEEQKFIAYVDFDNPTDLIQAADKSKSYCILIGPEGDFSTQELEMALQSGFEKVSLGKSRLRTETAGLVACHILNIVQ
ncbi:16S rRNA (uracil(1498)-N(3))-methyltransferase [Fulvivirga sp. RKSG066]|uniref:16S rRNA (uracil(1498)-N(3))-methyltransferase n=1 Tax=Fulvivirga aurantia TaxID=2529383 RepID=UPI0012BC6503|nr:16S rRNA (uracil(1498)-N(3))-methyltransferase [Fulvivirga aurantia]MTI20784.1 16S rRNA (uracil(1498)-N(3))-methyltransferase [Fulvivirga aurantia]